jgi:Xaa-Pro aminopeptidase
VSTRLDQLRATLQEQELDAFLVSDSKNRVYLSGFTGSSGALLVTTDQAFLITDFRYFEQAERQAPTWTLWKQTASLFEAIRALVEEIAPSRLGFEADVVTVSDWNRFRKEGPGETEWIETSGLLPRMRAIKSPEEVALIRAAQRITDEAATHLPRLIQPGRTEKQVAWDLHLLLHDLGADGPAFDSVVASGPNAALPHYRPGDRVIEAGEIVLVDFGARVGGYHSDMTRTYFTGEPGEEYTRIFNIVLDALHQAEASIQPGLGAKAADAVARDLIQGHGHGEHFGHGLGHGVGLDIHELPSLSFRVSEEEQLQAGNVITIEPGIYLPGWGGVRIEDLALVTEDGIDIFTTTPKDPDAWRKGQVS